MLKRKKPNILGPDRIRTNLSFVVGDISSASPRATEEFTGGARDFENPKWMRELSVVNTANELRRRLGPRRLQALGRISETSHVQLD